MGEVEVHSEADIAEEELAAEAVSDGVQEEKEEEREEEAEAALEELLTRHVRASKVWLFASILGTLFLALIVSVSTTSSAALTIIGFTPTILAAITFLGLLEGEYKDVLFWLTPLALNFLFLAIGGLMNETGSPLDIPVLTSINLILSYLILIGMFFIEYRKEKDATLAEPFKPEALEQQFHTLEDKCKAINFVIGRVYRASNGGTKSMREKIKIPSEWYNEFHRMTAEAATREDEELELARTLLERIQERLLLLLKPEKEVFTKEELRGLRNLARDTTGLDRILDVLSVNDNDPVEEYYLGAREFCRQALEGLREVKT